MHGDELGSVDRNHNLPGGRLVEGDISRLSAEQGLMSDVPYELDEFRRPIVLGAIREVCKHRGWGLTAAHVRSNHVHTVVEADGDPAAVMNTFKAYASRGLNELEGSRKRWARHGSTKWLWRDQAVRDAVRYVVDGQGEPMSVYLAEGW